MQKGSAKVCHARNVLQVPSALSVKFSRQPLYGCPTQWLESAQRNAETLFFFEKSFFLANRLKPLRHGNCFGSFESRTGAKI